MSRVTPFGMRLRRSVKQPLRYEDDEVSVRKPYGKRTTTKPAFPDLLAAQTASFTPPSRPAAFPSLPFNGAATESARADAEDTSSADEEECHQQGYYFNSCLDVTDLLDQEDTYNVVDFTKSNNLAAERYDGVEPVCGHPGTVTWMSLELAYQYRIFCAICRTRTRKDAAILLKLTNREAQELFEAVEWRKFNPLSLIQVYEDQSTVTNYLEPDHMMAHLDLLVRVSHYELGSPSQLWTAVRYLKQVGLPNTLLGTWAPDPLGSGQLIDATPLSMLIPVNKPQTGQAQGMGIQTARGRRLQLFATTIPRERKAPDRRFSAPPVLHRRKQQAPLSSTQLRQGATTQVAESTVSEETGSSVGKVHRSRPYANGSGNDPVIGLEGIYGAASHDYPVPSIEIEASHSFAPGLFLPKERVSLPSESSAVHQVQVPDLCAPATTPNSVSRAGERTSGPMNLRHRGDLKETKAMTDLRNDASFWPAPRKDSSTAGTPADDQLQQHAGPVRKKCVTLKFDSKGSAFIEQSSESILLQNQWTHYDGKTAEPALRPARSDQDSGLLKPPPPKGVAMGQQTPDVPRRSTDSESLRIAIATKPSTVRIDLPDVRPNKFGDAPNFDTKLLSIPADTVTTPSTPHSTAATRDEAASLDSFHTPRTHLENESHTSEPASQNEVDVQSSPLYGHGRLANTDTPTTTDLVDDLIEDTTRKLATKAYKIVQKLVSSRPPVQPKSRLRRNIDFDGKRSPTRPRSLSPISENEGQGEYQAFIRGERKHGPKVYASEVVRGRSSQLQTSESSTEIAVKNVAPMAGGETQKRELKITLNIKAPQLVPQKRKDGGEVRSAGLDAVFSNPGEEGDNSWAEYHPKTKKRKLTSSKTVDSQGESRRRAINASSATATTSSTKVSNQAGSRLKNKSVSMSTKIDSPNAFSTDDLEGTAPGDTLMRETVITLPGSEISAVTVSGQITKSASKPRRSSRLSSVDFADSTKPDATSASKQQVGTKNKIVLSLMPTKQKGKNHSRATPSTRPGGIKAVSKPYVLSESTALVESSIRKGVAKSSSSGNGPNKTAKKGGKSSTAVVVTATEKDPESESWRASRSVSAGASARAPTSDNPNTEATSNVKSNKTTRRRAKRLGTSDRR